MTLHRERPYKDGKYLITGRAEPDPWNKIILLEGSALVEEVKESTQGRGKDKKKILTATLATKKKHGGIHRRPLDITWLKGASETYKVSDDIRDYVFVNVPIVTADIPNRNMDCFTYGELTHFNPILGRFTYKTFVGKPAHADHRNQDCTKAKGVHFDATLRRYSVFPGREGYKAQHTASRDLWKVRVMLGFCRQKDSNLVSDILKRKRTGYSMGALIDYAVCSVPYCNRTTTPTPCEHVRSGKGRMTRDGYIIYDKVMGVNFFETSVLTEEPADPDAFAPDDVHAPHIKGWAKDELWATGLEAGK